MISLPKSLTEIGDEAFAGCSGFYGQIAEIPAGVTIGRSAFKDAILEELRTMEPEYVEVDDGD